jgi:hypothetical protein
MMLRVPLPGSMGSYVVVLSVVPLLGSFITEPAAMTVAALMLRDRYFGSALSARFKYATLGVLFVNVSIGGTLTSFGAPPVLMVAATWQWDTAFMFTTFGWKAALAVMVNALAGTFFFRKELLTLPDARESDAGSAVPVSVASIHLVFLVGVVLFAHHPAVFMGLFLFFLGYAEAYERYQNRLILREGLLVAFFLAGLVVLGGLQQWWLQRTLLGVEPTVLFFLATGLTAITDNAALTYLASLVQGLLPILLLAGNRTGWCLRCKCHNKYTGSDRCLQFIPKYRSQDKKHHHATASTDKSTDKSDTDTAYDRLDGTLLCGYPLHVLARPCHKDTTRYLLRPHHQIGFEFGFADSRLVGASHNIVNGESCTM